MAKMNVEFAFPAKCFPAGGSKMLICGAPLLHDHQAERRRWFPMNIPASEDGIDEELPFKQWDHRA